MSGSRARTLSIPLAIAVTVLLAGSAMATIAPTEVIGGRAQQYLGFANTTWVAWTAQPNSTYAQTIPTAFARPLAGGTTVRLNAINTDGFTGGFDPGTNTVIYQQVDLSATTNRSDLYFYDLDTDARTPIVEVNSARWEWGPRISASYILFGLDYRKNGQWRSSVELYDRAAMTTSRLGSWRTSRYAVGTGSVGDTYATWTVCSATCLAYVYDADTATASVIPSPNGRPQYAPVVDETSARVYFVRSATMSCGRRVRILRLPLADLSAAPTEIRALPDGIDVDGMSSAGGFDLLFSRVVCRTSDEDVYRLPAVDTVPDSA
jgi:hypothetical protein